MRSRTILLMMMMMISLGADCEGGMDGCVDSQQHQLITTRSLL